MEKVWWPLLIVYKVYSLQMTYHLVSQITVKVMMAAQWPQTRMLLDSMISHPLCLQTAAVCFLSCNCTRCRSGNSNSPAPRNYPAQRANGLPLAGHCQHLTIPGQRWTYVFVCPSRLCSWVHDVSTYTCEKLRTLQLARKGRGNTRNLV